MVKPIDFDGLLIWCKPCAHCGAKPVIAYQDYIGDTYVGSQFSIGCKDCDIDTSFDEWKTVLARWNRQDLAYIAIQALKDIVNPIGAMRRNLKGDERLEGRMAYMLSQDHTYLKSIAIKALKEMGEYEE